MAWVAKLIVQVHEVHGRVGRVGELGTLGLRWQFTSNVTDIEIDNLSNIHKFYSIHLCYCLVLVGACPGSWGPWEDACILHGHGPGIAAVQRSILKCCNIHTLV